FGLAVDVRDPASVGDFAAAAADRLGAIDIWVNNAAIYPVSPVENMSDEQWDLVCDINLRGCFLGCRTAARHMSAHSDRPGRVILNLASVSSFRGRAGLAHYVATKHGVVGLTKSLALELGSRGIRVMALVPTLVATPGIEERQA